MEVESAGHFEWRYENVLLQYVKREGMSFVLIPCDEPYYLSLLAKPFNLLSLWKWGITDSICSCKVKLGCVIISYMILLIIL